MLESAPTRWQMSNRLAPTFESASLNARDRRSISAPTRALAGGGRGGEERAPAP